MSAVGVGVVGLGVMGAQHVDSYRAADAASCANRLVAVCDASAERRRGVRAHPGEQAATADADREAPLFDPAEVTAFEQAEDLIAHPDVELVSICTHTDSHVPLARAVLEAGKHVLVEKPVALTEAESMLLAESARRRPDLLCMPAMCIRFWPPWRWVWERIRDGSLGAVRSARVHRVAPAPAWARAFYEDTSRSGGALVDLHVHDADFVRWCFGAPSSVETTGSPERFTTRYRYPGGPEQVTALGAWDPAPDAVFTMGFRVAFEDVVADYSFTRDPLLVLERGDARETVPLLDETGYDGEVRHLLQAIDRLRERGVAPPLDAGIDEAVDLMAMLAAERESLERGEVVTL